jgi:hypothetical protein
MRLDCRRCVAAYQKTFADATVEDIALKGVKLSGPPHFSATVRFSNGELIRFGGAQACGGKNQPSIAMSPALAGP